MNGVPMKLDYSKTINEQLSTFNYYKDRYCSYELELINDRKEIERLNNIINEFGIWLLERKELYETKTGIENNIAFSFSKVAFDKLQELKDSDKE